MVHFPPWLHVLAILSLSTGIFCAVTIALDEARFPQAMGVMNPVWPLCTLFGGPVWLWFYYRYGRAAAATPSDPPMWVAIAKGTSHCGAGCAMGDLLVEWLAVAMPGLAVLFGYGSLFGERTFALWIPDYLVAFVIGIVFQYCSIAPMRGLGLRAGIAAAIKADAASITAWQVGMYGLMALAQFAWLRPSYGLLAPVASVEFWFVMQVAMLAGFATAFPVNAWLIRIGVKEVM